MWHSCGTYSLDELFAESNPGVREVYDALEKMVLTLADVTVVVQKTRVAFQTRTRFAGGSPRRDHFNATFVFFRRFQHPRLDRVEKLDKWFVHHAKLVSPQDVDGDVLAWFIEAKRYGDQLGPDPNTM